MATVHRLVDAGLNEVFPEDFKEYRVTDLPTISFWPNNDPEDDNDGEVRITWTVIDDG